MVTPAFRLPGRTREGLRRLYECQGNSHGCNPDVDVLVHGSARAASGKSGVRLNASNL